MVFHWLRIVLKNSRSRSRIDLHKKCDLWMCTFVSPCKIAQGPSTREINTVAFIPRVRKMT